MNKLLLIITLKILFLSCSIEQSKELPINLEIELLNKYKRTLKKEVIERIYQPDYFKITGDSAIQKYYNIEINISNVSSDTIYIWLMSCSWIDNFIINNDYMFFDGMDCDKNSPISLKINPHDKKTFKTTLRKHIKFDYPGNAIYGLGVETTRLGLIVINDLNQEKINNDMYHLGIDDKSKWNIIWSNPILLHKFEPKYINLENK